MTITPVKDMVRKRGVWLVGLFVLQLLSIGVMGRSEEHTSELQSRSDLVCRLLLEKKKKYIRQSNHDSTITTQQSIRSTLRHKRTLDVNTTM